MKEEILLNIIFAILDQIPGGINLLYKFVSPLKIEPKSLTFEKSTWTKQLSFKLTNRVKKTIYNVYILIPIQQVPLEKLEVLTENYTKANSEIIKNISISYSILQLALECDTENLILIKIHELKPNSEYSFKVKTAEECIIKPKILEFKTEEEPILTKSQNKVAIPFKIPKKFPYKDPRLLSTSLYIKKGE